MFEDDDMRFLEKLWFTPVGTILLAPVLGLALAYASARSFLRRASQVQTGAG